jgi:hypothetical protein
VKKLRRDVAAISDLCKQSRRDLAAGLDMRSYPAFEHHGCAPMAFMLGAALGSGEVKD